MIPYNYIKMTIPLTTEAVKVLEGILWSEVGTKQDYEAEYGQKPLGEFVRGIVGLDMTAARGSIVEIFTDLSVWMGIRKVIDRVNANAIAA